MIDALMVWFVYGFRRWEGTLVADAPQAGAELNELTLIPRVTWNINEINYCLLEWLSMSVANHGQKNDGSTENTTPYMHWFWRYPPVAYGGAMGLPTSV